ncbi:MAG: nuclear transport factor 2 family protein [Steroidobacteraceae bacterium]
MISTVDDEASRKAVLEADQRRIEALVAGDLATLDALTADDYTHVETNGGLRTKAEFFALLARGDVRFVRWTIDENTVRLFGDVAVVTGRYRNVVRTADGEQPEKRARHQRVWVRRDGAWRNVAHQATRLP